MAGRSDDEVSDPLAATGLASDQTAPASDASRAAPIVRGGGAGIAAGTRIGRYVLGELLGSGGMGCVYAATDPELGRRVAIKRLHAHLAEMEVRLLREGQAIARLRHPNVVTIHDIGTHEGSLWIAMELVAGTTLRAWQATSHPWRDTLAAFIAAGRGLAAAHAAGLVHRDFKPDNVLLGTDGSIVVTDFGLARTASMGGDDGVTSRDSKPQLVDVTQSGAFVGTPAYMSPEQFRGDVVDARSDQFSFCVALFEALYGKRPFAGATLAAIQHAVLDEPIAPVPADSPVPPKIHAAIVRGLSRPSGERFASMEALLEQLTPAAPRRPWWPYAAGLLVVAAAILFVAFSSYSRRTAAVDPCAAVTAPIDQVWTVAARARTSSDDARLFDRFAQNWRTYRVGACRAGVTIAGRQAACLDRAAAVFAQLVERRTPADTDALALPSIRRCATGNDAEAVVRSVLKPAPDQVLMSPRGDQFASLDGERLTFHSSATGLATKSVETPGAGIAAMWTDRGVIALYDRWRSRLVTLISTADASGSATTTLPSGTRTVSPDLAFALVIDDRNIELHALGAAADPRVLGRLEPGRNVVDAAWSPTANRLALLLGPASSPRLQIFEATTGDSFEVSFNGRTTIGGILWHGDERLIYSDDGLWSLWLPRETRATTGARELPEPAERRVAIGSRAEHFELIGSNGTQMLARRVASRVELVRVHERAKEVMPCTDDLVRVKGMTPDNARIAIECTGNVGTVDWKTQQYTPVGSAEDVIATDGARILLVSGNELFEISGHDRRRVTTLPPSTDRRILACAQPGGTCALVSWGGTTPELRLLKGDVLGPPLGVTLSYRILDVAVSPDGTQLAFAGRGSSYLDVANLTTGAVAALALPADWACTGSTVVAWTNDGALLASQSCQGGLSRLVERAADGKSRTVFEGEGTITGFTPAKRDVYLNIRHDASELVVIDAL